MRVVVTVYPEDEDIEQPISWAKALGFDVVDAFSSAYGRCVSIRGDISAAELTGVVSIVAQDKNAISTHFDDLM